MCYNLRTISRPTKDYGSKLYAYRPLSGSELYYRFAPTLSTSLTVPCGKCLECLRRKQNDLAVRASIEANRRGSMCFVTLTYSNAYLPLSISVRRWDTSSGELISTSPPRILSCGADMDSQSLAESMFDLEVRDCINRMRRSPHARVITREAFTLDGEYVEYVITPTVCRRDIQLWLKSARVAFKRQFGHPLPEFSYLCCQEYGPNTCRPHAHLAFFGLSFKTVYWLSKRWKYGFFKTENVNCINKDGSRGFDICAKYISKYCSKGEFEADSVVDGLAIRPRLMISAGVGGELTPEQISYFRCEDILKVDLHSLKLPSGEDLDEAGLDFLHRNVIERSHWLLSGSTYCLPRRFIKQIWYYYDHVQKYYKASPLRKAISSLSFNSPLEDYFSAVSSRGLQLAPGAVADMVTRQNVCIESSTVARKDSCRKHLSSFYRRSIF